MWSNFLSVRHSSKHFQHKMWSKCGQYKLHNVTPVLEKFNKVTTTIKFFTSIFCFSLYYYISNKVLFSVAGYLKQSNETPTSM